MLTAICGRLDIVEFLVKFNCRLYSQHGSFLEARDEKGSTALFHAAHTRNTSIAKLNLDAGAN